MIKNVLIPLDGSENSNKALNFSIDLVKKIEGKLICLYVIDETIFSSPIFSDLSGMLGFDPYINLSKYENYLNEVKSKTILENAEKKCRESKIEFEIIKDRGIVSDIIIEHSRKANIIVINKNSRQQEKNIIGKTAIAVIKKSIKPILVLTSEQIDKIKNILVAYDGSVLSSKALSFACDLSNILNLNINILTIEDSNKPKNTEDILDEAKDFCSSYKNINIQFKSLSGEPEKEILEFAQINNIDLIVLGSHGYSRIIEFVLGDITSHIIRKSNIPILVIK